MLQLRNAAEWVAVVIWLAIAGESLYQWRRLRAPSALWVMWTVGAVSVITVYAKVFRVVEASGYVMPLWLTKPLVVVLLFFPYFLIQLARSVRADQEARQLRPVLALLIGMSVWTVAMPDFAANDEERVGIQLYYYWAFLLTWLSLFVLVASEVVQSLRQPSWIAQRRARVMAASIGLLVVLMLASTFVFNDRAGQTGTWADVALGLGGAMAFLVGLRPPRALQDAWRRPIERRLDAASIELMHAEEPQDIAETLVPIAQDLLGLSYIHVEDHLGQILGMSPPPYSDMFVERVRFQRCSIAFVRSAWSPLFEQSEELLTARLGSIADTALERVHLVQDLQAATDVMERAHQEIEAVVLGASHDLKNPLSAIRMFLHVIEQEHKDELSDDVLLFMERMEANAVFMSQLVQGMLAVFRAGHSTSDKEWVPIRDIVTVVREGLETQYPALGIEVETEIEVLASPDEMRQVFENLLGNAAKYGGRDDVRVRVFANPTSTHAKILVRDNGAGIPSEQLETVFDLFERLDNPDLAGSGVGLYVVRKIVRAWGGDIRARPSKGGALFEITLPKKTWRLPTATDASQEVKPAPSRRGAL